MGGPDWDLDSCALMLDGVGSSPQLGIPASCLIRSQKGILPALAGTPAVTPPGKEGGFHFTHALVVTPGLDNVLYVGLPLYEDDIMKASAGADGSW